MIGSDDVTEQMEFYIHIIADENYCSLVTINAYKQRDNNLYVGEVCSRFEPEEIIGKFIASYQMDKIILSVGYFDPEAGGQKEGILREGVFEYQYMVGAIEQRAFDQLGERAGLEDYSGYSGKWIPIFPEYVANINYQDRTYMDIEIAQNGEIHGYISQHQNVEMCAYAEFTGSIGEDGTGIAEYQDDGYGHSGTLTFTFYEKGIWVYVIEQGTPNKNGLRNGNNYYLR